jgi:hypothetical protein
MTHHPHIHMIVPGGGISLDGRRWISSRPAFLLPVRVLGALFRRLFLTRLIEFHDAGRLAFFGTQAGLADRRLFLRHLAPLRKKRLSCLSSVVSPFHDLVWAASPQGWRVAPPPLAALALTRCGPCQVSF